MEDNILLATEIANLMLTDGSVSISNYESTLKRINMLYAESFENLDEKYVPYEVEQQYIEIDD